MELQYIKPIETGNDETKVEPITQNVRFSRMPKVRAECQALADQFQKPVRLLIDRLDPVYKTEEIFNPQ